ncbi:MAG TPA: histone deacetylase family protein [Gemmataceae bacterium]|jgi:acetoin utilization deacetylase AcuC-like enzyme|nr:histone deacetylase family protein [Gemmataceae bacterium]
MKTVYDERHVFHEARAELHRGTIHSPPFERAERAERIADAVREAGLGEVVSPADWGLEPIRRVHDGAYLDFLAHIHGRWRRMHGNTDAVPHIWSCRSLRQVIPESIYGQLGYYSFDGGTPITAGTWQAALVAAQAALTGQRLIQGGETSAFALTRPPGHHAARDVYGGYCFINHAAVAAQAFRDGGVARVAVLDVDYHHGNGTQAIFYDREDVLFVSLHAHPLIAYPYFLGYAEERGAGVGEGFNLNLPLPDQTDWDGYLPHLAQALHRIADYGPAALVVSLGVDTLAGDPISGFRFRLEDFGTLGRELAQLQVPTLFVMEGGYVGKDLGTAVVNVLRGFLAR